MKACPLVFVRELIINGNDYLQILYFCRTVFWAVKIE